MLSWYWLISPERDFVAVLELPGSSELFAMASMGESSGAFVHSNATQLWSGADAQAAISKETKWTPPAS